MNSIDPKPWTLNPMCGRFALRLPPKSMAEQFDIDEPLDFAPRYNIAPTQPVLALRGRPGHESKKEFGFFHWGLIPFWAKDPSIGYRLINARSETAAEKPSFREAFKYRRCLISADGFYEWQKLREQKRPFFFHMKENREFAFAGLWEHWSGPDGSEIESCAILTTDANALMAPVHNRMPVIIAPEDYELWLFADMRKKDDLTKLLSPFAEESMEAFPVTARVNNPRNEGPACVEPAGDHNPGLLL